MNAPGRARQRHRRRRSAADGDAARATRQRHGAPQPGRLVHLHAARSPGGRPRQSAERQPRHPCAGCGGRSARPVAGRPPSRSPPTTTSAPRRRSFFVLNPSANVVFPMDVTVTELQVFGHRDPFLVTPPSHRRRSFSCSTRAVRRSSTVAWSICRCRTATPGRRCRAPRGCPPCPLHGHDVRTAASASRGLCRLQGDRLRGHPRPKITEPNLAQLLPTVAQRQQRDRVQSSRGRHRRAISFTNWYAATHAAGEFLELAFPVDVTVTEILTMRPR